MRASAMVSSGLNNLVRLVGGWAVALGVTAAVIMHFDEVRTALGLKLEPEDFGVAASAPRAEP
ncbi:MAG: hypothetical protein AB7O57_09655, partial [Hyphomicrobiaceae bacterium]